ncbi:hypothetical protein PMAYCL1PPCAC_02093, partial [Pristionchus mayeri]
FLRCEGDFLVRMSEPKKPGRREFVLSVMFDSKADVIKHFVINRTSTNKYSIDKEAFDNVVDVVENLALYRHEAVAHSPLQSNRESTNESPQLATRPCGHRIDEETGRRSIRRGAQGNTQIEEGRKEGGCSHQTG